MNYLLDTHSFVWGFNEPEKPSVAARTVFDNEENELILSVASIWEIQIKVQLGKLTLNRTLSEVVSVQQEKLQLKILRVEPAHVFALTSLPPIHRDPFDRMLIAQAIVENAILITADDPIRAYPVRTLW